MQKNSDSEEQVWNNDSEEQRRNSDSEEQRRNSDTEEQIYKGTVIQRNRYAKEQ